MENIKVIFVDIDGTIVNDNKQISDYTKDIIKKVTDKGMLVVLCSGRHNISGINVSKELNSSSYVISSNGALLYDYKEDKIINSELLDFNVIKDIWDYFNDNKIGCFVNTIDERYANKYIVTHGSFNKTIIENIDEIKDEKIYQIIVVTDNYNKCKKAYDYVTKNDILYPINLSYAFKTNNKKMNYYFIDLVKSSTNKSTGINALLKHLNIDKEQTMCFGDHINDVEMFNACNYKIAMGNASDELKSIATDITLSNNEDGVAVYLEKNIL